MVFATMDRKFVRICLTATAAACCVLPQYLEPAVSNAIMPLSQSDYVRVLERVLKLALPMLYTWLCMFYCLFHLWLNILAEVGGWGLVGARINILAEVGGGGLVGARVRPPAWLTAGREGGWGVGCGEEGGGAEQQTPDGGRLASQQARAVTC